MKKLFYSLAALFALTAVGCVKEDDAGKEPPLVYIDVPVSVGEDDGSPDTKSLVSIEVEDFHKAALFAFKASDHKILPSQTGGPLTLTTEEKTFSWSLPSNVEMNIYVLCNYGDMDLSNYLSNANLTESDLQALKFTCASGTELQELAQKGYGLPMAGVAENQVVNAQNNSLSLKVKKLFSRYDIYFDKSAFESKGYTINALYISASKSNTEVPYFVEGFQQTELSKLSLVDLGTSEDIVNLNQGDKTHAVTLYFLENCQGTKSGASKWYEVAGSSMEGLNLCSYVDIGIKATDADGNDANFFYWVYLGTGSGACVSDFNVTRNEKHTLKLTLKTPDEVPATKGIVFTQKDNSLLYNQTPQGSSFAKYATFNLPFETNLTSSETTYEIVGFKNYNTQIGSSVFSDQHISVQEKGGGSLGGSLGGSNETKYPNVGTLSFWVSCSNANVYYNPLTLRIGKKNGDSWVVYDECFVMISISAPSYKSRITKMVIDPSTVSVGGSATATVYGGTYNTILNKITGESTRAAYMFDWSSSDESVATVDSNGNVSGISDGTATISAVLKAAYATSYESPYTSASASVTVGSSVVIDVITWRMKSLSITPSTIQVGGSTTSYSAIKEKYVNGVASGETADADVTGWSSSSTSIATVSGGTVTGVAAGTATITVTDSSCETGYTTADASVTVTTAPPSDDFEWIDTSISMDTDGSSVTAEYKSSGDPSFSYSNGIDVQELSYSSATKKGSVKISISNPASFSDGDNSASVTGTCGTASDVLDITVHKPVFTYHKKVVTTLSSSTIQWSEYSYASATLYTTTYRDGVNKGTTNENVTSSGFVAYSGIHVIFEDGYKIRAGSNTESSIGSVNIKSDYPGADEYEDAVLTIEKKQYYIPITVSEDDSGGYEIVVDEYNDGKDAALPCSVTLTFEFTDGVKPTVTLSAGQKYETFTPLGSGHGNLESVTLDPSSYDDHCEHYTFSVSMNR